MKKHFFFTGAIVSCLLFSCNKNGGTPKPTIDSLSIPLNIGTWWKYQRNDTSRGADGSRPVCCSLLFIDSSIEQITVIGKTQYIDTIADITNSIIRFDKVNAFMLDVKNLTKGTVDTNYFFYNNDTFKIKGKTYSFAIKLPLVDGQQYNFGPNVFEETYIVKKDTSMIVLNNRFDHSIFYEYVSSIGSPDKDTKGKCIFLNPNVGFVYWKVSYGHINHYNGSNDIWFDRKLIDYHLVQ